MADYSINLSGKITGVGYTPSPGDVVGKDANGNYVKASSANITAGCVPGAIVISLPDAFNNVQLQDAGQVSAAITGLGAGAKSPVVVGSAGNLVRKASPVAGDIVVGDCNANGDLTLYWGSGIVSTLATGNAFAVQVNGNPGLGAGNFKYNYANAQGGLLTLGAAATAATANGMESIALIDNAIATGQASCAIGHSNVSNSSWAMTFGSFNTASQVGTFAGGEEMVASGANSAAIGFNGRASTVFGYVYGNACFATGNYALGLQNGASATRSGEMAIASGCSNVQRTNIDLARTLAATTGKLLDADGNGHFMSAQTAAVYELSVIAFTANGAKMGSLVTKFSAVCKSGPTIALGTRSDQLNDLPAGYTVTLSTSGAEILFTCNPTTDTAAFKATLRMLEGGNIQSP